MSHMDIVLIVLVIAGVWAVIEIALTLRSTRKSIEEVTVSANQTIEQVQPIIAKLDGMMDELDPTVKQLPALMEKVDTTVDAANSSLESLNVVLGDVATVSGAASAVTATVSKAASDAVTGVVESVSKIGGGIGSVVSPSKLAAAAQARLQGASKGDQQKADETLEELPLLSTERSSAKAKPEGPAYVDYGDEAKGTKSAFVAGAANDAEASKEQGL